MFVKLTGSPGTVPPSRDSTRPAFYVNPEAVELVAPDGSNRGALVSLRSGRVVSVVESASFVVELLTGTDPDAPADRRAGREGWVR